MATHKPELHSIDAVLSYFDQYDDAGYMVFAGHKPDPAYCRFTYSGNDKGIGREKLYEALQSVVSNPENTNSYLLQILREKGKKLEAVNSITFQLNKPNSIYPAMVSGFQNYNPNNEILSKLRALEEKIDSLESEEEEEEEEPEDNVIGSLLNNPQIKNMLVGMLANIMTPQKVQAIAGVPDEDKSEEEKIKVAIDVLKQNTPELGDKLLKLADMSVNNASQYQWLIKML